MRAALPPGFAVRLAAESDRACAVLGAAWVDESLQDLFRRRLRCHQRELLSGALQAFSARILLARALDWIDADARRDLDSIRGLRNDFAHGFDQQLSFADRSVADRCRQLRIVTSFVDGRSGAQGRPLAPQALTALRAECEAPRRRFELAVELLARFLAALADGSEPPDSQGFARSFGAQLREQA